MIVESLVDVSVSTLIAVERAVDDARIDLVRAAAASISASVNSSEMCVAMSGSIIPTPLAIPTTRAAEPATVADATLATVSVVIIPAAGPSASVRGSGAGIAARPGRIRSIGYRRPITPVDVTTTSSAAHPSRSATVRATSSASSSPSWPVATLAFFEITTTARASPLATCRRDSVTLGPAKRLFVNNAATGTGRSAAITTRSSVSSFTPMFATCARKPSGQFGHCAAASGVR